MKKLLLVLLLLFPFTAYSAVIMMGGAGTVTEGATGDSCTGALKLSAHFENSDTITTGTPAGCNTNADQTWALGGSNAEYSSTQESDGSYSFHAESTEGDEKRAIITADVSSAAGTIVVDVYPVSIPIAMPLVVASADASNYVSVLIDASTATDVSINYVSGGSGVTCTDTNHYLTTNSWHTITAKWSTTAVGGKYQSIQIDANAATTCESAISALTGTPSTLTVGNNAWNTQEYYLDKLKVYDTWQ